MEKCYSVRRCSGSNSIDADWDKPFWKDIEPAKVDLSHWSVQFEHIPDTEVKLQYDAGNLYVIFRVQDCYVRAVASGFHGEVWKDSCVEFFFSPNTKKPDSYFNIETNCCGDLLTQHHTGPRVNTRYLDVEDCQGFRVVGSVSHPVQDEITKPLTWTLEYIVPFEILSKYADIIRPEAGVTWRGNFYKCADESSHPHWITWSPIAQQKPDFHRPQYFGTLQFV